MRPEKPLFLGTSLPRSTSPSYQSYLNATEPASPPVVPPTRNMPSLIWKKQSSSPGTQRLCSPGSLNTVHCTVYTCLRTAVMETEGLLHEEYEFNGRFCSFHPPDYLCLSDDHIILLKVPE